MADRPLVPAGMRLRCADGVARHDGDRVLVGGDPPRLLRLTEAGAAAVGRWFAGAPVEDAAAARALARRLLDAGVADPDPTGLEVPYTAWFVVPAHDEPGVVEHARRLAGERPAVVVDDGSAIALRPEDGVEVLRRTTPGGPGVARQAGIEHARAAGAEIVVFVDADVEVDRSGDGEVGWAEALIEHFADPAVAAVAPRVGAVEGPSVLERYEATFPSLDLGARPAQVGPGRAVSYIPTAALAVRVDAFDAVGGFDPSFRYGEDVDLVWRLVAAGHVVRYAPDVVVRHRARPGWRAWARQRRAYGSSAPALAARHGDAVAPARAPVGVYATVAATVVAPAPVAAVIGGLEFAAAHRRVRASLGPHHDPALVNGGLRNAFGSTLTAIPRTWLPLVGLALFGRRSRRRMAVVVGGAAAMEVASRPRHLDPVRATLLRVVDHVTYGVGVLQGLARVGRRGHAAVRPVVSAPGVRSPGVPGDTVAP